MVEFTHLWVDHFGWENTVYCIEDFKEVELLGNSENDGNVYICIFDNDKTRILKGYERN